MSDFGKPGWRSVCAVRMVLEHRSEDDMDLLPHQPISPTSGLLWRVASVDPRLPTVELEAFVCKHCGSLAAPVE